MCRWRVRQNQDPRKGQWPPGCDLSPRYVSDKRTQHRELGRRSPADVLSPDKSHRSSFTEKPTNLNFVYWGCDTLTVPLKQLMLPFQAFHFPRQNCVICITFQNQNKWLYLTRDGGIFQDTFQSLYWVQYKLWMNIFYLKTCYWQKSINNNVGIVKGLSILM